MTDEMFTRALDLLKAGGILAGVGVTLAIFFVVFKYIVPLVRPNGGGVAPILEEIRHLATTIETHVPTKADLLEQFAENRHDMRNAVAEGVSHLQLDIQQLAGIKIRKRQRRRKERRK